MENYPGREHEEAKVSLPVSVVDKASGETLGAFPIDVAASVAAYSPVSTKAAIAASVKRQIDLPGDVLVDNGLVARYGELGRDALPNDEDESVLLVDDEAVVAMFGEELEDLDDARLFAQAMGELALTEPVTDDTLREPGLNIRVAEDDSIVRATSPFLGDLVELNVNDAELDAAEAGTNESPDDLSVHETTDSSDEIIAFTEPSTLEDQTDFNEIPSLILSDVVELDVASVYHTETSEVDQLTVRNFLLSEIADAAIAASMTEDDESAAYKEDRAPLPVYVLAA